MLAGWLQGPMDAEAWEAVIPSMGYMACLAEGTPVWLADGTTAPIEDVVARKLPVLSYDKAWDSRPVKYGPNQGPRDQSVGNLVPTIPSAWLDTGVRPIAAVRFASGRVIEATYDHRWVRQRRSGRQAWEWNTTSELRVGDRIPVPLTADTFGDEGDAWDGYFVGGMLGDGGMTVLTPEFHGDPNNGAVAFMREYAAKHGCDVREDTNGAIVRMRFPFKQWKRNPLAEILRRYEVWGKRCEAKALPNRPFSREFWIGALSGLIDTDGCVRERTNAKGTLHGSVEYATVSRRLAEQVSDVLLRLGVTNIIRERAPLSRPDAAIQSRHTLFVVETNRATALVRLAELLDLRISYKAARLASLAERLAHVAPASSEMHGYDKAVALDRVVAIEDAGERATYCVTVDASNLFVANGIVTGNCLRNLRNFDETGVPDDVAEQVIAKLKDPAEVARSRQLPFRFLSAYRAAPSLRWSYPLEVAIGRSLGNVPALSGRTLILVDTSGSMNAGFSKDGTLMRWDAAALFGIALGHRCAAADVVSFSSLQYYYGQPGGANVKAFPLSKGESVLRSLERWRGGGWFLGGGTETAAALRATFQGHDRVVVLTDEQAAHDGVEVTRSVPESVPMYTWNLAGYARGHAPSGGRNRHAFGGLTDQAFKMIPLLEGGRDGSWPWDAETVPAR
jgi:intein/homing endonuclease